MIESEELKFPPDEFKTDELTSNPYEECSNAKALHKSNKSVRETKSESKLLVEMGLEHEGKKLSRGESRKSELLTYSPQNISKEKEALKSNGSVSEKTLGNEDLVEKGNENEKNKFGKRDIVKTINNKDTLKINEHKGTKLQVEQKKFDPQQKEEIIVTFNEKENWMSPKSMENSNKMEEEVESLANNKSNTVQSTAQQNYRKHSEEQMEHMPKETQIEILLNDIKKRKNDFQNKDSKSSPNENSESSSNLKSRFTHLEKQKLQVLYENEAQKLQINIEIAKEEFENNGNISYLDENSDCKQNCIQNSLSTISKKQERHFTTEIEIKKCPNTSESAGDKVTKIESDKPSTYETKDFEHSTEQTSHLTKEQGGNKLNTKENQTSPNDIVSMEKCVENKEYKTMPNENHHCERCSVLVMDSGEQHKLMSDDMKNQTSPDNMKSGEKCINNEENQTSIDDNRDTTHPCAQRYHKVNQRENVHMSNLYVKNFDAEPPWSQQTHATDSQEENKHIPHERENQKSIKPKESIGSQEKVLTFKNSDIEQSTILKTQENHTEEQTEQFPDENEIQNFIFNTFIINSFKYLKIKENKAISFENFEDKTPTDENNSDVQLSSDEEPLHIVNDIKNQPSLNSIKKLKKNIENVDSKYKPIEKSNEKQFSDQHTNITDTKVQEKDMLENSEKQTSPNNIENIRINVANDDFSYGEQSSGHPTPSEESEEHKENSPDDDENSTPGNDMKSLGQNIVNESDEYAFEDYSYEKQSIGCQTQLEVAEEPRELIKVGKENQIVQTNIESELQNEEDKSAHGDNSCEEENNSQKQEQNVHIANDENQTSPSNMKNTKNNKISEGKLSIFQKSQTTDLKEKLGDLINKRENQTKNDNHSSKRKSKRVENIPQRTQPLSEKDKIERDKSKKWAKIESDNENETKKKNSENIRYIQTVIGTIKQVEKLRVEETFCNNTFMRKQKLFNIENESQPSPEPTHESSKDTRDTTSNELHTDSHQNNSEEREGHKSNQRVSQTVTKNKGPVEKGNENIEKKSTGDQSPCAELSTDSHQNNSEEKEGHKLNKGVSQTESKNKEAVEKRNENKENKSTSDQSPCAELSTEFHQNNSEEREGHKSNQDVSQTVTKNKEPVEKRNENKGKKSTSDKIPCVKLPTVSHQNHSEEKEGKASNECKNQTSSKNKEPVEKRNENKEKKSTGDQSPRADISTDSHQNHSEEIEGHKSNPIVSQAESQNKEPVEKGIENKEKKSTGDQSPRADISTDSHQNHSEEIEGHISNPIVSQTESQNKEPVEKGTRIKKRNQQ
ncbi:hypothetical protein JTE90_027765 [Oedothorax gibbosus]|uniref:Uncharacterized protein n=1 Tax=Oedothorax gibbosus TaxID=931172 RepID=A0AAV6V8B8_9ARAC|nr:hypothetical protein JTE90_027765 [Oedothorax gibbosus]